MSIAGFFQGTGMPDPDWWEALWPDPAGVLAACGVRPGMDVIDLCCGDGWFTQPLSFIARSVVAVDIDPALLAVARARLAQRAGPAAVTFLEANAYEVQTIVGAPFDCVFLANAFHGVPDQPRLARAVHGVLKPGGLLALVSWHARPREETIVLGQPRGPAAELRMSPEQTIAAVEEGGLRHAFSTEVSPYHYGVVFTRAD